VVKDLLVDSQVTECHKYIVPSSGTFQVGQNNAEEVVRVRTLW